MFPKTKYGIGGGSITVNDAHHEKSLGPDWSDNPPPIQEAEQVEKDEPSPKPSKSKASAKG
jgi:hypothetical protein